MDAQVLRASSQELPKRETQESPELETFISTGMIQEQACRKATSMPGSQQKTENRLQPKNLFFPMKVTAKTIQS